eukprot:scaffold54085_cov20-Tisochrysis_lutea.AAC.1
MDIRKTGSRGKQNVDIKAWAKELSCVWPSGFKARPRGPGGEADAGWAHCICGLWQRCSAKSAQQAAYGAWSMMLRWTAHPISLGPARKARSRWECEGAA